MKAKPNPLLLFATFASSAFAIDGVTLINQATVQAAGGFPYTIGQPGSYKLSGNLVTATSGLNITASNVTLDMNGFSITASAASMGNGIYCSGDYLTVSNGTISGFSLLDSNNNGGAGIYVAGSNATLDRLRLLNNYRGVTAPAIVNLIASNLFVSANQYGIIGNIVTITNSIFNGNQIMGLIMGRGSVMGNVFNFNGGSTSIQPGVVAGGVSAAAGVFISNVFGESGSGAQTGFGWGLKAATSNSPIVLSKNSFFANQNHFSAGIKSSGDNACDGTTTGYC